MLTDARSMWVRFETYHDVTYFTAESRAATDALGCKGGWMGYFGMRAAPLGAASPELVTATFYNFHPDRVARAIPDAWGIASPEAFLRTRLSGVDGALRRMLAEVLESAELAEAAVLLRSVAERAPVAGRPLAAANAALPWPAEPHLVLWQATTRLRESRGDGHVAALVSAGLDPCETLVLFGVERGLDPAYLRAARGWSEEEWARATDRLAGRGLLTGTGELTGSGSALRRWVEERTDESAAVPWLAVGEQVTARVAELLTPISLRLAGANEAMKVNPLAIAPVAELTRLAADGAG
jgi:Helix-turn-helix family